MPQPTCSQCPNRYFISLNALLEHARNSGKWHPYCHLCDRLFLDQHSLETHTAAKHPTRYPCTLCVRIFATDASLKEHYRGTPSEVHPNCPRCGLGFFDKARCDEHLESAHPKKFCSPCKMLVYEEVLQKHYVESPTHPSCTSCAMGFEGDHEYNEHGEVAHSDMRCSPCGRQFESIEDLLQHYVTSAIHPTCLKCEEGYVDDETYHKHVSSVHVQSPTSTDAASNSRASTPPSVGEEHEHYSKSVEIMNDTVASESPIPSMVAAVPCSPSDTVVTSNSNHVTHKDRNIASPTRMGTGTPTTTIAEEAIPQSMLALSSSRIDDNAPKKYSEPYFHLTLAMPDSTMSTSMYESPIDIMGPHTTNAGTEDVGGYEARSPVVTTGNARPTRRNTMSLPLRGFQPTFDAPYRRTTAPIFSNQNFHDNDAQAKSMVDMVVRLVDDSPGHPSSTRSFGVPPMPQVPTPGAVTVSELGPPRNLNPYSRSFKPTPTEGYLRLSRSEPCAPFSPSSIVRADVSSGPSPFELARFNAAVPLAGAHPYTTSPNPGGVSRNDGSRHPSLMAGYSQSPSGVASSASSTSVLPLRISLRCRLCHRDPCQDMTATMCGHIFCFGCITEKVAQYSKCPICRTPTPLQCLFRIHLEA